MPVPALAFRDVVVERDGHRILDRVTAEVTEGAVTVLAGPSGAGKSSLLRLCNRLDVADSGVVEVEGEDVAGLDPLRLRRDVAMIFQQPTLFGGTVRDNLHTAAPGADRPVLEEVLGRAALDPGLLGRQAATLSGGEAQRCCLARALLTEPRILLADEPTSALDAGPRLALERLACDLAGDGLSVLWVTHDAAQLRRIADAVLVLDRGRLVRSGTLADVEADPLVTRLLEGSP